MKRPRLPARIVLLVAAGALLAAAAVGVLRLGLFLVVADPLQPSDAIFVLEGKTPAREVEAAALYRRGLAPRIVVAHARDPMPLARRLSGEPTPQERAVRALAHLGVPPEAVVRLTREAENTQQELAADFEYARAQGFRRVILVTSPVHTRRVRVIWRARYQSIIPAAVHPTPYDPYNARRWWRSRRPLEETIHEALGIVHFLIGSPLPTYDHRR